MRITKPMIRNAFLNLLRNLGKVEGYEAGEWGLDYNSIYGGWVVVEYMQKGGEHHPLLKKRLPTSQFYDALHMANLALELKQREETQ